MQWKQHVSMNLNGTEKYNHMGHTTPRCSQGLGFSIVWSQTPADIISLLLKDREEIAGWFYLVSKFLQNIDLSLVKTLSHTVWITHNTRAWSNLGDVFICILHTNHVHARQSYCSNLEPNHKDGLSQSQLSTLGSTYVPTVPVPPSNSPLNCPPSSFHLFLPLHSERPALLK